MWLLKLRPEIESDIRSGEDWYNSKLSGLGDDFVAEFWLAIDKIKAHPLLFAIAANGLRPCRIARFSYLIHFRVVGSEILVIALMGAERDDAAFRFRG